MRYVNGVIGSLGRFHAVKDHATFVRAAGLLAQQYSNVRFLLVGRDLNSNNRELAGWITATGYEDRFVLLGEQTDVPICLSAMDIYCLHSCNEGFPNGLGEAMAMGLPCVTTDVGDARFLISDTGVIVPKGDAEILAHSLKSILEMPQEKRFDLGQKANARIQTEFTIERCIERYELIYTQLLTEISV